MKFLASAIALLSAATCTLAHAQDLPPVPAIQLEPDASPQQWSCRLWQADGSYSDVTADIPFQTENLPPDTVAFACRLTLTPAMDSIDDPDSEDDDIEREIGIRPPPIRRDIALM